MKNGDPSNNNFGEPKAAVDRRIGGVRGLPLLVRRSNYSRAAGVESTGQREFAGRSTMRIRRYGVGAASEFARVISDEPATMKRGYG